MSKPTTLEEKYASIASSSDWSKEMHAQLFTEYRDEVMKRFIDHLKERGDTNVIPSVYSFLERLHEGH